MNPNTNRHHGAPHQILTGFFEKLLHTKQCSLLLDYDGTLAPFNRDPYAALPYPGVLTHIDAIMDQHDTRLIIITGRAIVDLLPLLNCKNLPEIWGSHGWQRRYPNGRIESPPLTNSLSQALIEIKRTVKPCLQLGARLEDKPFSIAIHWRGLAPENIINITSTAEDSWENLSCQDCLELHRFDGGIEFRLTGRNKGDVVKTVRDEIPGALIAYLGDDMTDEDAFVQLNPTDLGILVRPTYRPTAARLWLRPPQELLYFLQRWFVTRQHHHEHA